MMRDISQGCRSRNIYLGIKSLNAAWRPAASLATRANAIWLVCQLMNGLNRQHADTADNVDKKDTRARALTAKESTVGCGTAYQVLLEGWRASTATSSAQYAHDPPLPSHPLASRAQDHRKSTSCSTALVPLTYDSVFSHVQAAMQKASGLTTPRAALKWVRHLPLHLPLAVKSFQFTYS